MTAGFVGRLKEIPAVMSQGETLGELQTMIRDAYALMVEDAAVNAFVPIKRLTRGSARFLASPPFTSHLSLITFWGPVVRRPVVL